MHKVTWTVTLDSDRYIRVVHSKRGQICVACLDRNGRISDITFDSEADRKSNMIRIPAMTALQHWENSVLNPIIDARGCSRDTARVHAGWTHA